MNSDTSGPSRTTPDDEDVLDLEEAAAALAEQGDRPPIPWAQVKAALGLDGCA